MFGFHLHKPRILGTPSGSLAIVGLIVAFSVGIFDSVLAIHLEGFVGDPSIVGLLSAGFTLAMVIFHILVNPFVERTNERLLFIGTSLVMTATLVSMFFIDSIWVFVAVILLTLLAATVRLQTFSVLIRDSSSDEDLGEVEGFSYALRNVGWLVAPLILGFIIDLFSVRAAFLASASFMLLAMLHFRTLKITPEEHEKGDLTIRRALYNLKEFLSQRKFVLAYFMYGGVSLWWGFMYTYIPLFVILSNLSASWVGLFLSLPVIPLVLLEVPFGRMVKTVGFRRLFVIGYSIIAIATAVMFAHPEPLFVLVCLIIASTGAAMLESTREAYFFLLTTKREEERYVSTIMTSNSISSTMGKLIVAAVLIASPFFFSFLAIAVVMLFYASIALFCKEPKSA